MFLLNLKILTRLYSQETFWLFRSLHRLFIDVRHDSTAQRVNDLAIDVIDVI